MFCPIEWLVVSQVHGQECSCGSIHAVGVACALKLHACANGCCNLPCRSSAARSAPPRHCSVRSSTRVISQVQRMLVDCAPACVNTLRQALSCALYHPRAIALPRAMPNVQDDCSQSCTYCSTFRACNSAAPSCFRLSPTRMGTLEAVHSG